ncbi:MAG: hypothetical protein Q8Q40_16455 [Methylococcaceae bacterium]|nr:hypothetical protein [Methylococcaceae bacterium]MDP3905545.1 hypothetical protein [Methylococcaceae bacterium]
MNIEQFEELLVRFQGIVEEHGAKSKETEQVLNEIAKLDNQDMTPEHIAVWRKLGMLPTPAPSPMSLALAAYQEIIKTFGEDSPEATVAFLNMLDIAPPEYLDAAHQVTEEMFGMPNSIGVTEDGESLYALNDIAEKLDISVDDATKKMFELETITGKKLHYKGQRFSVH